jgi:hypothetical protein
VNCQRLHASFRAGPVCDTVTDRPHNTNATPFAAGPADLLTVKAHKLLSAAQVVVYDDLSSQASVAEVQHGPCLLCAYLPSPLTAGGSKPLPAYS